MSCENVCSVFISGYRELTDAMLVNLADSVTTVSDVRKLAVRGLGMESDFVQIQMSNNLNNCNSAMFEVLRGWRKTQPDNHTAYINLHQALKSTEMNHHIIAMMDGDSENFEDGKVP